MRRNRFLIPIVLTAAAAAGFSLAYPRFGRWHVQWSIRAFERSPSQAKADRLVEFIRGGHTSDEQTQRIFRLLLTPKVTTRESYPVWQVPKVRVELPFALNFRPMQGRMKRSTWIDGRQADLRGSHRPRFATDPELVSLPATPMGPDTYQMEIRYEYSLWGGGRTVWRWNPRRAQLPFPRRLLPYRTYVPLENPKDHTFRLTVPVELAVVERGKAEELKLVSGAGIDAAMQTSFTCWPDKRRRFSYFRASGRRTIIGTITVGYGDLPVAASFECVLRLADGREIVQHRLHDEPKRLCAHKPGSFGIDPRDFLLEEPGQYDGIIVLRPDPNYAYEDPALKTLWMGTLEFPIHLEVQAN
jgi:hypothetical protein